MSEAGGASWVGDLEQDARLKQTGKRTGAGP